MYVPEGRAIVTDLSVTENLTLGSYFVNPRIRERRRAMVLEFFPEIANRLKENPTLPFVHLTNVVAAQGALPIKVGDDVIGAVGVSGAPGGDKDEICAKTGLDKVADQLK